MHTALDAVRIIADPHGCVLIHLSAVCVEDVIIVADLCKSESKLGIIVVVGESVAAVDKACFNHFAVLVKCVPPTLFGDKVVLLSNPNGLVNRKLAVCVSVVILAVERVKTVSHLNAVDCEVKLAVLVDDSLLAVDCVGDKHLTCFIKVVHTALDAVRIIVDPHCGILIHSACSGIEDIIIVADLREALSVLIVLKVICLAADCSKAVGKYCSVGSAPVIAVFKLNIALFGRC